MDFSCSLPTRTLNISQVQIHHLSSISRPCRQFTRLLTSVRPLSIVCPILHHRFESVTKHAASPFCSSKDSGTFTSSRSREEESRRDSESYPRAIIIDVAGMTSDGSAATVQRILENHPQVYVAIVNHTASSVTVWPISEAKVTPNWQKELGEELEKFLASHGFKSKHRDIDTLHGSLKRTPYSDWTVEAVSSISSLDSEMKSHTTEVEALKVEVKDLLLASKKELTKNIEFINSLCRLGVSYRFDDEINEHLDHIFDMLPKLLGDKDYDLCTIANLFRLMRQRGYNVTCDVFQRFQEGNGEFKKDITNDVKGMLCLYEACFLAFPCEKILDEALSFTRKHLHVIAENSNNPQLERYIRTALMFPSHKNGELMDASFYISFYEQDERANEVLLRFAKLNFNGLQLLYKKDLAFLSKWWRIDTNFMEKFPYIRHRLVESYLWSVGSTPEPEYRFAQMILTKYGMLLTLIDDTYDNHGTIEQLQLLTSALERGTINDCDELPMYMKNIYKVLYEEFESNGTKGCFDDLERNCTEGHPIFDDLGVIGAKRCSYKTTYVAELMIDYARALFREAKWKNERKAPSFDEYIKNGKLTCAVEASTGAAIILTLQNMGMKEILWLRSDPAILDASQHVSRLTNDVTGQKDIKERRDFPKAVDCYMKQYGVSEEEAIEAIEQIIEDNWKVMNREIVKLKASNIPKVLLKFILSYARMTYVVNGPEDGFTYTAYLKEFIKPLLIDPLPV